MNATATTQPTSQTLIWQPPPPAILRPATLLRDLALAAKIIGADMKISVNGAGMHFRDVSDNHEGGGPIDVGGARAKGGQNRPDPAGTSWEITLGGPVEDDFSGSFYESCVPDAPVLILAVTGMNPDELEAAGPWYVRSRTKSTAKGEALIESVTIKASYGGLPVAAGTALTYPDPDTLT